MGKHKEGYVLAPKYSKVKSKSFCFVFFTYIFKMYCLCKKVCPVLKNDVPIWSEKGGETCYISLKAEILDTGNI